MSVSEYPKVLVSEVGPRDGLQSIRAVMPTAGKLTLPSVTVTRRARESSVACVARSWKNRRVYSPGGTS